MFCSNCGYKLEDTARFCSKCGVKIQASVSSTTSYPDADNAELNRDALKIYLRDILSLECIKKKYQEQLNRIRYRISQKKGDYTHQVYGLFAPYNPNVVSSSCVHMLYQDGRYYVAYVDESHFNSGIWVNSSLYGDDYSWLDIEQNIKMLKKPWTWRQISYPFTGRFEGGSIRARARDSFFNLYENFKSQAADMYQNKLASRNADIKVESGMRKELSELESILKKAYDINIIPSVFRNNLYAIYYLYDLISTSQESLSTALLHYDLNEIKRKLDKIISQQQEIIIQQAVALSQNQQIMEANKMQLEKLSSIEANTELAAQYSEIASNNAAACAWIGLANYIQISAHS